MSDLEFIIPLDEVIPSEQWEPVMEFVITQEINQYFMDTLDDHNPWFTTDSPFGGPIANPGVLHEKAFEAMGRRFPISPHPGSPSFHQRQVSELHHPAKVGEKVKIEVRLIDKYVKRNRDYILTQAKCTGENGRLLLLSSHYRMIGKRS